MTSETQPASWSATCCTLHDLTTQSVRCSSVWFVTDQMKQLNTFNKQQTSELGATMTANLTLATTMHLFYRVIFSQINIFNM